MNSGRFVLSQVLDQVYRQALERCAQRYNANDRVRHFGCRQQLTAMVFAQMTWREGLRDIEACLNAKPEALYHLGFSEPIARSTRPPSTCPCRFLAGPISAPPKRE
jgi:hypothetical protein